MMKKKAIELLSDGTVTKVLGWKRGEFAYDITPAVFETAMKLKYSSDSNDAVMYDIIRDGISFDTGRIFCEPLDKLTFSAFREACNLATPNWTSIMKAKNKIIQKRLEALITSLDSLPE